MSLIEVKSISKEYNISKRSRGFIGTIGNLFIPKYEIKEAVKDINFTIEKGEMVGFIGPNGAGKSTTVKMLSGILHPTSGDIKVYDMIPYKNRKEYVKKIGVVFGQKSQLWWDLPVIESYEMFKYIYKISDSTFKKNLDMVNEILGVNEFIEQPVRQLSLGQRVRADIGASLLHEPEVLFLDEPTIGLDVVAKENVRNFLNKINKETNVTMLFTTHDMQDIEKTCDRMIIIDKGEKIYDGLVSEIKSRYGKDRQLEVEFVKEYANINIPKTTIVYEDLNTKRFQFNKDIVQVQHLISQLTEKYDIKDLTIKEPDIESIIREIYEGGIVLS
ncbi:ATP-binding cassette domain-containing protein [Tissierella sp.]|uniref:ABC transporter ATP-binding protein n=1 Tax=Tissierella sp. TaxID=41274 RepID=UPI00285F7733|nr:ATP-binding cassette domain-containing protein [Tissierella sp.]MDR7857823.1 ATP-binding cassette domain-containing protein [Tissierella sp.]